jgi:CO/xanthine dehydrogenase Mo-binding subunit
MSSERTPITGNVSARLAIEPERYELHAPPVHHFEVDRRDFVKIFGAGIAVFLVTKDALAQQGESGGGRRGFGNEQLPKEISAWIHIGETGAVTVFTGKAEVGQNIRTSLAQAVAEELRVSFGAVTLVMADTALTPWDAGTFGSRTTPTMGPQLRHAASAACDILVNLAAKQWNLDQTQAARLVPKNGEIIDPQQRRSLKYGELAKGQALAQAIPDTDPLVPVADWVVSGKSIAKADGREFVTGEHKYTSDIKLPGMLYGKVLRPISYGAKLASVDLSAAQAMPGVACVHDGDFVAVAAPDLTTAEKALAAIRAQWNEAPTPVNSTNVYDYIKQNPQTGGRGGGEGRGGERPNGTGNIEQGLALAAHKLDATYTVAYIAHAPLEPRAAVASWDGGKLMAYTGSQRPFGVRDDLVGAFHMNEGDVHVIVPDTGSAYGGKHTGECAVEAARIAKGAGKPVKLIWTREEEFTWAYFRPVGVMEIRSGIDAGGKLTAWEYHNYNSGPSAMNTPYDVANKHEQFHNTEYPLRQGSYRALAATANMFARESHMDDLAHAANLDPLEFRLKNLPDDDAGKRIRDVLLAATKSFGWTTRKKAPGVGYGLACGTEKNGYIATCVAVAVNRADASVKIARVTTAFDCGTVINPDGLRNQIAGSNVMGMGGALFEAIQFANGKIENPKFSKYRVPRFKDVGELEVVLVDRKDIAPAGAGETPLMGLAPAIGNAIFDATGTRLRALPLVPNGLKA